MLAAEFDSSVVLHNVQSGIELPDEPPLERLLTGLETRTAYDEQIQLFLEVVRDATHADIVFWYRESEKGDRVICGGDLPSWWCVEVARQLLAGSDPPETLPPFQRSEVGSRPLASAALVRISKRKSAWVVALGLDTSRPITRQDVERIRLARRILRNHRRQTALFENLRSTLFSLIQGLTKALEAKDPYTCGHSERVARIAVRLSQQMNLPEQQIGDIYLAGLLHDIGKIGIRDEVLAKPGALTESEYKHVQQHPIIGHRILKGIAQLEHLIPGVRGHHERVDGLGYPDGKSGNKISLMARILAVADACDAMMSPRPYRPSLPPSAIIQIMRQGAGTQWDAEIVEIFLKCSQELFGICEKGIGDSVFAALDRHLTDHSIPFLNGI